MILASKHSLNIERNFGNSKLLLSFIKNKNLRIPCAEVGKGKMVLAETLSFSMLCSEDVSPFLLPCPLPLVSFAIKLWF